MKNSILLCSIFCVAFGKSFAFSDSTIQSSDFKMLTGCWTGTLTYLDYKSNKPYSMPAEIKVENFRRTNYIPYATTYPNEPKANSLDTLVISGDGKYLNNKLVIFKKQIGKDSLIIITEIIGKDGNDHKPALLRHIYTICKNSYSIRKEVQFQGEEKWILRHEYRFIRKKPC